MLIPVYRPYQGAFFGSGYIAGEAPTGLVTVNGSAAAREVEVRDRLTRTVVATMFASSSGVYRFDSLSPDLEFDVIGRDYAGIYNDAIVGRVRPEPYSVTSATGSFTANDSTKTLDGAIDIVGGESHVVTVVSGAAPAGITFSVVTGGPPTYTHVARWLIASGTTSAGSYTWTLRVTGANHAAVDIPCSAVFT